MQKIQTTIFSFDVFDTVITRTVANPIDVFAHIKNRMGQIQGVPEKLINSFSRIRRHEEIAARRKSSNEDISIKDIYNEIQENYNLEKDVVDSLISLEIQVEREFIKPISPTIEEISRMRARGSEIIFISDMYLPQEFIESILLDFGAFNPGDRLYLSGQIGLSKATGSLYRYILNERDLRPDQLVHYGDNKKSDIDIPQSFGIKINSSLQLNLNASLYENLMLSSKCDMPGLKSVLVGASHAARLGIPHENERQQIIGDISANIAAPAFYSYIWWVLLKAKSRGIKSLYFMSRDGHILLQIARIIEAKLNTGISLKYLYVSRESLLLASIANGLESDYIWLITYLPKISINNVCELLDTTTEELTHILVDYGFKEEDWDIEIDHKLADLFWDFFKDQRTQEIINKNNQTRFDNTLGYLRQEGLTENNNFAVVDIGWQCHSQMALSSILDGGGQRPSNGVSGFYFGFGRKVYVYKNDSVFSFSADLDIRKVFYHYSIFEVFASATHGKTVGYAREGDNYVPVLNKEENSNAIAWGLDIQERTILKFSEYISEHLEHSNFNYQTIKSILKPIIFRFTQKPTPVEADIYGDFLFSCYLQESGYDPIAPKLSRKEFWEKLIAGDRVISLWFSGTFSRSNLKIEGMIWNINIFRRVLQSYIRVRYGRQKKYFFNMDI